MFKGQKNISITILIGAVLIILVGFFIVNANKDKKIEVPTTETVTLGITEESQIEVTTESTTESTVERVVSNLSALQLLEKEGMKTLCDADGNVIQLKGMSTHGLQWFPQIINNNAFAALSNDWNSNVIRLALYVGENGYASNASLKDKVIEGIDLAIANKMYVVVDWHVHDPGDPNADKYKGAMDFFTEISSLYPNNPNIIYELANEPNINKPGVTNDAAGWEMVKSYAEPIIKMLRDNGNENLVIVGSPNWSQRPDLAADNPIDDQNTIYSVHFYSGTHMPAEDSSDRSNVMSNVRYALENGVAVFSSEWGTSEANGNNGPYLKEADIWLDFFDENNISWCNWSLTNKDETSGAFQPLIFGKQELTSLNPGDDQVWAVEELSVSGEYVRSKIKGIPYAPIPRVNLDSDVVEHDSRGVATLPSDFEDGTLQGWFWFGTSGVQGPLTIEEANGSKAISWNVTYPSEQFEDTWLTAPRIVLSEIGRTRGESNALVFDFYIKPEGEPKGSLLINLAFAPPDLGYWAQVSDVFVIDLTKLGEAELTPDGLYYFNVLFDLNKMVDNKVLTSETQLRDITIVVEDQESEFTGSMFLDQVRFE